MNGRASVMDRERMALDELQRLLCGPQTGTADALDESALRAACSAACLATYPDASGAMHEMDVRRLLGRIVEAYAQNGDAPLDTAGPEHHEPVYHRSRLCDALRRLCRPYS